LLLLLLLLLLLVLTPLSRQLPQGQLLRCMVWLFRCWAVAVLDGSDLV
jgi:hypothetical protein